jgi:hypothetical protein
MCAIAMHKRTTLASGKVLEVPLLTAIQGTAREPLAFTILDVANRLTTCAAAEASRVAERDHGRFIATWSVA